MALKSMLDVKEGWQAERHQGQRVWHYIVDTMALCRSLGFYTGDLVPDAGGPRDSEDCARCYRILRKRTPNGSKTPAAPPHTEGGES